MKNNIYNVGNEKLNLSKLDVCNAVKKKTGGFVYFAEIGEDLDKRNYIVSYEKIKKVGFKNKYDLNYGIDELIKSICLMNFKNKYTNI
jgi:nucleoside-diphosphate-sugar epimerase